MSATKTKLTDDEVVATSIVVGLLVSPFLLASMLALGTALSFYDALFMRPLWAWFVAPYLGFPTPPLPALVGLDCLVSLFLVGISVNSARAIDKENALGKWWGYYVSRLLYGPFALVTGWLVHLWLVAHP